MKKIYFAFFLLLFYNPIKSQTFEGKIIDRQGNGIAFVSIGIPKKNIGTYSFEDGTFYLNLTSAISTDTILIKHLGYKSTALLVSELKKEIRLYEKPLELNEIIVKPLEVLRFGINKKKSASSIYLNPYNGAEVAVMVEFPKKDTIILHSLFANLSSFNMHSFKIRGRIYSVKKQIPDLLLFESEVFSFPAHDGVVELKLRQNIQITNPVFISFEWLATKEEVKRISKAEEIRKAFVDSLNKQYDGVVIIYNNKKGTVSNEQGDIITSFKLKKKHSQKIRLLEKSTPRLKFKTTKSNKITMYRSYSHGEWYRYSQSLIAGIIGTIHDD